LTSGIVEPMLSEKARTRATELDFP
jgi:hypothetical protein